MSAKKHILTILISLFVIHMIMAFIANQDKRPMPSIGAPERWDLKEVFLGQSQDDQLAKRNAELKKSDPEADELTENVHFWQLDKVPFVVAWAVILFYIFLSFKVSKSLQMIPGRFQAFFEILVEIFDNLTTSTLGKKKGRFYLPLIFTIFIYVIVCNWVGVIPTIWQIVDKEMLLQEKIVNGKAIETELSHQEHSKIKEEWKAYNKENPKKTLIFAKYVEEIINKSAEYANSPLTLKFEPLIPAWIVLEEPTQNLNTTLGLGLLVFLVVFFSAWKKHGLLGIFKELMQPFAFLLPLNIIGEIGKVISHSFRIFGNIKGGSIIFLVITYLTYNVLLPVPMFAYFGVFAGTVQALVFTMLAMVYIAVWIVDESDFEIKEEDTK